MMKQHHTGGLDMPPARILRVLSLAPTPIFASLALLSAAQESTLQSLVCSAGHASSPLTGMVSMYMLMSVFHSAPWLRMIARYRPASRLRPFA